ncbi:MAG: hypothetical protein BMS9Abin39_0528 [Ignavibacteria bacterium]|nr:MAG: hypothetical protein BMS9Abin39_0528 [Ignavibacteria bacterium]
MLREVRRKFASSISVVQGEEDFLYNSWLRATQNKAISIGTITSKLGNIPDINYDIEIPFSTKHFFLLGSTTLYPEDKIYFFGKIGTNPVFFSLLYVPPKLIDYNVNPESAKKPAKKIEFLLRKAAQEDIVVKFILPEPISPSFKLLEPEIRDYLSNLKTKVEKIELLNLEEIIGSQKKTDIQGIKVKGFGKLKIKKLKTDKISKTPKVYKIQVPGMGKYKSTVTAFQLNPLEEINISDSLKTSFNAPSISSDRIDISTPIPVKYYDILDPDLDKSEEISEGLKDPNELKDVMKLLLKNSYKVEWDKRLDLNISLTEAEETSARFLAENDRAFLADELGLEKEKECLAAIKFLFQNRVIHSSLIIVPTELIGFNNVEKKIGSDSGWIGNLIKYCPEFSYSVIKGNDDERSDAWNKSALVYITDYETMLNDFNLKILEHKRLSKFECIIMDEIQLLLEKSNEVEKVFRKAHPTVFWALSSITENALLAKVNDILSEDNKIEKYMTNNLLDVSVESPTMLQKEFWLEPSDYQQVEYKETFSECKKEFKKVLESGNPFRFQSNIFTLVHKLYQVENFAKAYETSPKTELLIQHLKIIQGNKQKVIILSQYDRQGTKKIEKLLDHFKISFVSVPAGLSAEDMKKSISLFKNKKTITALLSNAKESRLNFGSHLVPYIIKFDSWWNPVMNWQLEQIFNLDSKKIKKLNINVFTYKMLNSIDEDIKRTLLRKELFDKNILSVIPISMFNDLISIEEWLKIFEMEVDDKSSKKIVSYPEAEKELDTISIADFRAILSKFFYAIGYKSIDILVDLNSASFDITGEGKIGGEDVSLFVKVLLMDVVSIKTINEIIPDFSSAQKSKIFIIAKGKIEGDSDEHLNEDVTLITMKKLAKYLVNFNLIQNDQTESETIHSDIPWRED